MKSVARAWMAAAAIAGCGSDGGGGGLLDETCGDTFVACGGDVEGTWAFTDVCLKSSDALFEDSDDFKDCTDKPSADLDVDLDGEATFGADGAFSSRQSLKLTGSLFVPQSCVDTLAKQTGTKCEDVQLEAASGGCTRPIEFGSDDAETSTGTYTVDGSSLTIDAQDASGGDGSDDGPDTADFCVRGSTLSVKLTSAEGLTIVYSATKK